MEPIARSYLGQKIRLKSRSTVPDEGPVKDFGA
jgi:hypothetical protein